MIACSTVRWMALAGAIWCRVYSVCGSLKWNGNGLQESTGGARRLRRDGDGDSVTAFGWIVLGIALAVLAAVLVILLRVRAEGARQREAARRELAARDSTNADLEQRIRAREEILSTIG